MVSYMGFSGTGTWSAGGALIIARYAPMGTGTQNEGLIAGGYNGASLSCTEIHGTSWSAGGTLQLPNTLCGAEHRNAGLAAGGLAMQTYLYRRIKRKFWPAGVLDNRQGDFSRAGQE